MVFRNLEILYWCNHIFLKYILWDHILNKKNSHPGSALLTLTPQMVPKLHKPYLSRDTPVTPRTTIRHKRTPIRTLHMLSSFRLEKKRKKNPQENSVQAQICEHGPLILRQTHQYSHEDNFNLHHVALDRSDLIFLSLR